MIIGIDTIICITNDSGKRVLFNSVMSSKAVDLNYDTFSIKLHSTNLSVFIFYLGSIHERIDSMYENVKMRNVNQRVE